MNDRFKFRVWSKLSNVMSYNLCMGNFFQRTELKKEKFNWVSVSYGENYISFRGDALKELVLMQCTGLKDKNGKLIYEGDVVNGSCGVYWGKMIVEYNVAGFVLNKNGKYLNFLENDNYIEVIGNIYQDSHLLEN